jgi:DNA-directed RNA polymerase specialized sigma24 family protein
MRGIQKDLQDARKDEREAKQRIQRLEAAQALLRGEAAASAPKHLRRITRADVREYLTEHPGSYYTDIAEALGVPPTNVGTHLSNGKRTGEFQQHRGRWSLTETTN